MGNARGASLKTNKGAIKGSDNKNIKFHVQKP